VVLCCGVVVLFFVWCCGVIFCVVLWCCGGVASFDATRQEMVKHQN